MSPRLIGRVIGRRLKSQVVVYDALLPVAEQRCLERDLRNLGQKVPSHVRFGSPFSPWPARWADFLIRYQGRLHSVDHGDFSSSEALDAHENRPRVDGDLVRLCARPFDGESCFVYVLRLDTAAPLTPSPRPSRSPSMISACARSTWSPCAKNFSPAMPTSRRPGSGSRY